MHTSLYIHFPFCLKKCLYCDFNSLADSPVTPDEYVVAVVKEMALRAGRLAVPVTAPTLYFGGGTPSLMSPGLVARVIDTAQRFYGLAEDAEITIEANPGTVTAEKLAGYRAAGVNRLSLGVQSFSDAFLQVLGRIHTAREAREAFAMARDAGFTNIGIDLIHSLPGETGADWQSDLDRAVGLDPEHISAYGLSIEEGTPFHLLDKEGRLPLPDEEEGVLMFRKTREFFQASGYEQYEISNYARPGFRSRHNQVYWQRGDYLGFGAGAHSFLRGTGYGRRWRNQLAPEGYLQGVSGGSLSEEDVTDCSRQDAMAEVLFLGLRMTGGVSPEVFRREFGVVLEEAYPGVVSDLVGHGLLEQGQGLLRLSEKGLVLANQVFLRFI